MRTPIASALILALLAPVPGFAQAADSASSTVQMLDEGLLGAMKSKAPAKARAATIGALLDRTFDLALMTRLTVGPGWTGMAPGDQQELVAAFRRMTVAQYAKNFDEWSGESFAVDPNVEERAGDKLVRTSLNQPGKASVPISYRLRRSGANWQVIDVFFRNSISQIATRRSDFAAVLAKGGAKALIAHLDSLAEKGGD